MSLSAATVPDALLVAAMCTYVVALVVPRARPGAVPTVAATGAGVHLLAVVGRGLAAGHVPWSSMYEYSAVVALLAVVAGLWVRRRDPAAADGVLQVTLGIAVVTLGAGLLLAAPPAPLVPALDSPWLAIHTAAAVVASGVLSVGAAASGLYLWTDRARVAAPVAVLVGTGRGRALPPSPATDASRGAVALDTLAERATTLGFLVWTFAVLTGAVWAEQAWGRYWGWDPKETAAFVTWVLYAAYLHARATPRWRGRRAAWLGLGAYAALWVTYYVVNLVVVGLHSYA